MIQANDPTLRSWIPIKPESDFPIQNLPFGIFSANMLTPRAAVAIGDYAVDLAALQALGYLDALELPNKIFERPRLNDFLELGKPIWRAVRNRISQLLNADNAELRDNEEDKWRILYKKEDIVMHMPVNIGDYTDFYSSIEHATNVGKMFRDPDNALLPNWKHIPVGYHGRSSSIVLSGTDIVRPKGQLKSDDAAAPSFGPSRLLDFELEMAFITGASTQLGDSITTAQAEDHIFGLVLFNDWSARDIQKWEYVPLGPFLGKSFGSSISPWIVTLDALDPFRTAGPQQDPEPLPYLHFEGDKNYDINLQTFIQPEGAAETLVCQSNFRYMYWNMCQQLTHQSSNGCNIGVGDMYASGTISGPTPDSFGSMLELTWRGSKPITLADGSQRKFINDGDTVIMRGYAERNGVRVGFGEVASKALPSKA